MISRIRLWFRKLAVAITADYNACVDPDCDCWKPDVQEPEPEIRPEIGRTMCADPTCRCNGSDY